MAEDDRAAKAARAKAMLKKRQQQKKAGGPSAVADAPISRTASPAPSQVNENGSSINEFGELQSPSSRTSTLELKADDSASLEPRQSSVTETGVRQDTETSQSDAAKLVQDQRQTISLLVSEKASLSESLERFEGVEHQLRKKEVEYEDRLRELHQLESQLTQLQEKDKSSSSELLKLRSQNTQLTTKLREEERELQLARGETQDLRSKLEQRERRTRELEEQIQNDDTAERLQTALKNIQDRAEELEFQLSKIRQSNTALKSDVDRLQGELHSKTASEQQHRQSLSALKESHSTSEAALATLRSENDSLQSSNAESQRQLESAQESLKELNRRLDQSTTNFTASTRQLESAQAELQSALRRTDEAEKAQRGLQDEGTRLMRSLDEMRPKIVELTGVKLELSEKIDSLNRAVSQRDAVVVELESQLEEMRSSSIDAGQQYEARQKDLEREKSAAERSLSDLQRAYSELQTQLDDTLANTKELDADRTKHRQTSVRQQEEIENLIAAQQNYTDEIQSLQQRLGQRGDAEDEEQRLVYELQSEIEALRAELSSKDDELSRLRQGFGSSSRSSPGPTNLKDEVQSAVNQQHDLEYSEALSRIRSLENSLYDEEAKCHSLQLEMAEMADELAQLRSIPRARHPAMRGDNHAEEFRRTSFSSQRTDSMSPRMSSTLIDEGLPPATRHQRHVSLAMLQARIYSEAEAASSHPPSRPPSSLKAVVSPKQTGHPFPLPALHEHPGQEEFANRHRRQRPQFLDESHVFWCASCKGDLIVL